MWNGDFLLAPTLDIKGDGVGSRKCSMPPTKSQEKSGCRGFKSLRGHIASYSDIPDAINSERIWSHVNSKSFLIQIPSDFVVETIVVFSTIVVSFFLKKKPTFVRSQEQNPFGAT